MNVSKNLSKQIETLYLGGNWSVKNIQETISDISLSEANIENNYSHTIGELIYHINYFVRVVSKVLEGQPLVGNDKLSFDLPKFQNESEWTAYKQQVIENGKLWADLVSKLPETIMDQDFVDKKYGTYYENISGIIEHSYYHLGQINNLKNRMRSFRFP